MIYKLYLICPHSDEIDVIICLECEKEHNKTDGVVVVEKHKLGVRSWGVKALFLYSYERLMEHWRGQDRDCSLSGTEQGIVHVVRSAHIAGCKGCTYVSILREHGAFFPRNNPYSY